MKHNHIVNYWTVDRNLWVRRSLAAVLSEGFLRISLFMKSLAV